MRPIDHLSEEQLTSQPWGDFATRVVSERYLHKLPHGQENWSQLAKRVSSNVFGAVYDNRYTENVERLINNRQLMPGGRYLYAAGRALHQTQNCLLFMADDSREGWADHYYKHVMGLSTGAGIGSVYSGIRPKGTPLIRTGGVAGGPVNLALGTNEVGRTIRTGGDRRAALWAGLHWWHEDVMEFITIKNWSADVRAAKAANWDAVAPMDMTNHSVCLDDAFFEAMNGGTASIMDVRRAARAKLGQEGLNVTHDSRSATEVAQQVYWAVIFQMLATGDPGFSIDVGANAGEWLRNACVPGHTEILTDTGYRRIDSCVDSQVNVWNGYEWSTVTPKITGTNRPLLRVKLSSGQDLTVTPNHVFWVKPADYHSAIHSVEAQTLQVGTRLAKFKLPVVDGGTDVAYAYTQGFISGDGMDNYRHLVIYDTKHVCIPRLSGEAGKRNVAKNRTNIYVSFEPHPKVFVPFEWSLKSRLDWFAGLLDSDGTELKEGGAQIASVNRSFLISVQKLLTTMGVVSKVTHAPAQAAAMKMMPDGRGGKAPYHCQALYRLLVGATQMQALKKLGLHCERMSFEKAPQRDASQFVTVVGIEDAGMADIVYCFNEPKRHLGCFEGVVTGQCTEISSHDDSDICNIGSLNMARFKCLENYRAAVDDGTAFLIAGSVYSDLPYDRVAKVRTKNRRLGLGNLGVHEWLMLRGKSYGPDDELGNWLGEYAKSTAIAGGIAHAWNLTPPVKTRAQAPNGTIGIVAETTTSIEPLTCVSYKRRVKKGDQTWAQYVIDPVAQRLINMGVKPHDIETAYSLAESREGIERRVAFQAWFQQFVDHGISSTINMPSWGSADDTVRGGVKTHCPTGVPPESTVTWFGEMLLKYLPKLRGITVYPDGARGGQPITQVSYETALKHAGQIVYEQGDICDITKGGSCGA